MTDLGKLQYMQVSGFKSIENARIYLHDLNILIGANGSGKSNFIGVFRFLHEIANRNLQFCVSQQLGADKLLFFGRKRTNLIEIYLKFSPNDYRVRLAPDVAGGLIIQQERGGFYGGDMGYSGGTQKFDLAKPGARESGLPSPDEASLTSNRPSIPAYIAAYLRDWKVYHFHDTSESARIKQPGRYYERRILLSHGENLAAFLRSIRDTGAYALIVRTIQRVAPFFLDFVLEPEQDNPGQIRLRWRHRGSDETFDASDLSDGTLRFICLTTLLLQPALPRTILLDEPELGLHPHALQILAGMLRSASSKTQIIASTQSVTLANQFSWKDLIVVDRVDDASRFRRLKEKDIEQWLDDYAVGELWEKNILGGTP
jgi:predicted ATPase